MPCTKEQVQAYLEKQGECPFCHSLNITADGENKNFATDSLFAIDGKEVGRDVICLDCKKRWREYFKLYEIEELEEEA